jgi:hypothetical protein
VVSFATHGLWLWSWRYFESLDDPTAKPMPSWIGPTIDLGSDWPESTSCLPFSPPARR